MGLTDISYGAISLVMETWEQLRRIKNYEEVAGSLLFRKLFEIQPSTKVLFGFPIDVDPHSPELLASKRFLMHASYLIEMLDTALNMLGPDIELLSEIMLELADKHVQYGVKPEFFPAMGDALLYALEELLTTDTVTKSVKLAWRETYHALSSEMIRAMVREGRRGSLRA